MHELIPILPSYKKSIKDKIKSINDQILELNQLLSSDVYSMDIPITTKKEKKSQLENMVYTDGSCSKNGTKKATGGIGIYIYSSVFGNDLKIGKRIDPVSISYHTQTHQYAVSNIRTEGFAILYTMILFSHSLIYESFPTKSSPHDIIKWLNTYTLPLLKTMKQIYKKDELVVKKQSSKKQVHIFTDSKFWMDVYTSWLPNWIRKGIMLEKKNIDLLLYGYYYYTLLQQNNIEVVFHHVYSHQKGEKMDEHAHRNNEVDVIAVRANTDTTNNQFLLF